MNKYEGTKSEKTANNEENHAKMWLKELNGIGDTVANLTAAAEGENYDLVLTWGR